MSGIIDGVSKLWAVCFKHGALNLTGFKDNREALAYFVRVVCNDSCTKATKFRLTEEAKHAIRNLVEVEISNCEEDE